MGNYLFRLLLDSDAILRNFLVSIIAYIDSG
jgi:hypothetical protein